MILHSTDEPALVFSALSCHIPFSEGRGEVSLREFSLQVSLRELSLQVSLRELSLWEVFIFPCFS